MRSAGKQKRLPKARASAEAGFWIGVREIYALMSQARRRQLHFLLVLMLIGAVAELAAIGAVLPFLSLLAQPTGLDHLPWAVDVLGAVGATTSRARLIAAGLIFSGLAVFAGAIRLRLAWSTQDFVFRLGHELLVEIQRRILLQPYSFHIHRHTSTLISSLDRTEVLIFDILLPLMQAVIGAFIAGCIIAALAFLTPFTAAIAAAVFSLVYLLAWSQTRGRLSANSAALATAWDDRLKIVQESLGGIRDVVLDHTQAAYLSLFERVNEKLSLARARTAFISSVPRHLVETVGIVLIAAIAVAMSYREGGFAAALPVLGAVALGAQRLLPLLQLVYHGWSTVTGHRSVMGQMLELLRLPVGEEHASTAAVTPLPFRDRIRLDRVSFDYPTRKARALDEISLEITCGTSLALVGETGSGKSTLADLLMDLLEPSQGEIRIDGVPLTRANRRRWQLSIAHVPQSIFLADASIAANVPLSVEREDIDLGKVAAALDKAQLHEFVASLPAGADTVVGEAGIRLSGGQRQRLGIARALYKNTPVLVLDEATSALDEATEAKVIEGLKSHGEAARTIIMIAHRASTISRCDLVARVQEGRLVELGSYSEVVRASRLQS